MLPALSAQAERGQRPPDYVPPIEEPYDGGSDEDPFESPFEEPVENPVPDGEVLGGSLVNPGADPAGGGDTAGPAPDDAPAIEPVSLPESAVSPGVGAAAEDPKTGGILSRTGAETMALVRAGLAALALGGGLVLLGRRRRVGAAA